MSLLLFGDDGILLQFPESDENFLYIPYKSENRKVSISGVVLHESLHNFRRCFTRILPQFPALFYTNPSTISLTSRTIVTKSEYVIKFLHYLVEVVNVYHLYISSTNRVRSLKSYI